MASRIRKNDTVQIMAGKDKGKTGEVLQVFPKEKSSHRARYEYRQTPHQTQSATAARRYC